jgi:predicted RNA-binding Zn ribbon-like protein
VVLPRWVPDIETKPAPMPLLLLQSYVNTYEGDTDVDLLGDLETARGWLGEAGLLGEEPLTMAHLEVARRVREALRDLLVQNAGGPRPTSDQLEPLVRLAAESRFVPVLSGAGRVDLQPGVGAGGIELAGLLLIVRDAQSDGTWKRLKACRNDDCRWAFYDRSHAERGAWCDMATCGNRIKNRNLRSRRSSRLAPEP